MDTNIETVKRLYSGGQAIDDMKEYTTKGLKKWEKEVVSCFPAKSHILDIGCGMGREAFCLYDMGFSVTATDISETAIESAKQFALEGNRNVEFLLSNGLDLFFDDNSFDVVIIWAQTFGLFYGAENQRHILQECHRVLKNGGILSFSGHNKEFVEINHPQYVADGKKFFAYTDTDCYWELFTVREITELVNESGFEILSCKTDEVFIENENPIIHCECRK